MEEFIVFRFSQQQNEHNVEQDSNFV